MIEVVFDSIFNQEVDAIVNPANMEMRHGGGLAAMIAQTCGDATVKESKAKAPIPTGTAITTTAGNLSPAFKGVIHTVGPIWDDGDSNEDEMLASAYKSAMDEAAKSGWTSVAFPAVSCGVFRFPVKRAAPIAIKAIRESQQEHPEIERVVVCLLDEVHYAAFEEANAEGNEDDQS